MRAVFAVSHSSEQKTTSRQMTKHSTARSNSELGNLAEALVAQWLTNQGWQILQRRWHCRWGELDLIARSPEQAGSIVAFVEVKARSSGNWDQGGLLAITPQKQMKLWHAAELFLSEHPDFTNFPCRFDVALVKGQRLAKTQAVPVSETEFASSHLKHLELEQPIEWAGYCLTLTQYIEAAFD